MMQKTILLLILIVLPFITIANDGAFYTAGNQLIPIYETDICISKEVLRIEKQIDDNGNYYAYITVNYTFYNPKNAKTLLVGFEAPPPSGDAYDSPEDTASPYISDFTVLVNQKHLKYKTARITQEDTTDIFIKTKDSKSEVLKYADYYYIYYFNAMFKPGKNTITHTYKYKMSGSVMTDYSIDYILTAAGRWANQQIDDFTLQIDMGDHTSFFINNTFFDNKEEWQIENGRSVTLEHFYSKEPITKFITHTGGITFNKKYFKPTDELFLFKTRPYILENYEVFDYQQHDLASSIVYHGVNDQESTCTIYTDETSYKILRNLPFAIRGYVFKTQLIQNYYLSQSWYIPNPNYKPSLKALTKEEQLWLKSLKKDEN